LELLRQWLLVPYSLWPVDYEGIGTDIVASAQSGKPISPQIRLLLELARLPGPKAVAAVAKAEKNVEVGVYDSFTATAIKYSENETLLKTSQLFNDQWSRIRTLFDLKKHRDPKGIIRRSMVQERNFRPDFEFSPRSQQKRFQSVFDAFCQRWNLYGMEWDNPLPLKVTVNTTAYGTIIFLPTAINVGLKREIKWAEIRRLHQALGANRQGPKASPARLARFQESRLANQAWLEAGQKGFRGERRVDFVRKALGLGASTDARTIRRIRNGTQKM
jgi:hypothetical protein